MDAYYVHLTRGTVATGTTFHSLLHLWVGGRIVHRVGSGGQCRLGSVLGRGRTPAALDIYTCQRQGDVHVVSGVTAVWYAVARRFAAGASIRRC